MRTVSESMYSRREGILVWYDKSINNGFVEAVNNIQTTRRMAREFGNINCFIVTVCLCNGKLEISFNRGSGCLNRQTGAWFRDALHPETKRRFPTTILVCLIWSKFLSSSFQS